MIVRKLLFAALRMAANNPEVRKQAAKAADKAVDAARPSLLKASRRAGEAVRSASNELKDGVQKFKTEMQGSEEVIPPKKTDARPKTRRAKKSYRLKISPSCHFTLPCLSEQSHRFETDSLCAAHNDMVMQGNGYGLQSLFHLPCHVDICFAWAQLASGMIMHNDKRGSAILQGMFCNLPREYGRSVDCT